MVITESELRTHLARNGPVPYRYARGDFLTQTARDFARERGIPLEEGTGAPAGRQGFVDEAGRHYAHKPEFMTHLHGNVLVDKTHPRIILRGQLDTLQAALLQAQLEAHRQFGGAGAGLIGQIQQVLDFVRTILASEVTSRSFEEAELLGDTLDGVRDASHNPAGGHRPPHWQMGACALALNLARTQARQAELCAAQAFLRPGEKPRREDLLRALNRVSSAIYLLYCQSAARTEQRNGGAE